MSRTATAFEPLETRQLMSGGNLDLTFGQAGIARVNLGFNLADIVMQSDGKMVVVGDTPNGNPRVARLNADGTLDRTFAGNGVAGVNFGETTGSLDQVAVQRDGKIVVAGISHNNGRLHVYGPNSYALARFNPDGTLDRSFSGDGKALLLGGKNMEKVGDVAIQPDGKIVFVGDDRDVHLIHTESDFMVVRVLPDGSLDKTFGTRSPIPSVRLGYAQTDMGGDDVGSSVVVQRDGKIVVGGTKYRESVNMNFEPGRPSLQFIVARYLPDGRLDTTFDGNGKLATNLGDSPELNSVAVQVDGKIVAAGTGNHGFAIARYNVDGSLDRSFNGGIVLSKISSRDDSIGSVFVDRRGIVTAVGLADHQWSGNSGNKVVAVKYLSNGTVDASFGQAGFATLASNLNSARALAATTGNGKLVAAASGLTLGTFARFYQATPHVDVYSGDANASEDSGNGGSLIVGRDAVYDFPTRVWLTARGSARLGNDYAANALHAAPSTTTGGLPTDLANAGTASRYVDIPAGRSFVTVPITIFNDRHLEPVESAVFSLSANSNYVSGARKSASVFIADDDSVHVNFQPLSNINAASYVADTGAVFGNRGNGLIYGWDADNSPNTRCRTSAGAPDIRYATYNHMQKNGTDRKWEIALPNGIYQVRLVAGDSDVTDSVHRMNLEGVLALSGTPYGDTRWFRRTSIVNVTDGRLTLSNSSGAHNNKIAFIDIKAAQIGAQEGAVTSDLPVRLYGPQAAADWHQNPSGLFSDSQIDESLWS